MFERLVAHTDEPENDRGCWVWNGATNEKGYGKTSVRVPGKQYPQALYAHRAMHEAVTGAKLETWQEVDHECQNTSCVNPDHFTIVTKSRNSQLRHERRRKY